MTDFMDKKKYGWKIWNEETEKEGERGREKERERDKRHSNW